MIGDKDTLTETYIWSLQSFVVCVRPCRQRVIGFVYDKQFDYYRAQVGAHYFNLVGCNLFDLRLRGITHLFP